MSRWDRLATVWRCADDSFRMGKLDSRLHPPLSKIVALPQSEVWRKEQNTFAKMCAKTGGRNGKEFPHRCVKRPNIRGKFY